MHHSNPLGSFLEAVEVDAVCETADVRVDARQNLGDLKKTTLLVTLVRKSSCAAKKFRDCRGQGGGLGEADKVVKREPPTDIFGNFVDEDQRGTQGEAADQPLLVCWARFS